MRQIGKVLKFILLTANLCMAGLMLLAAYSPLLQPAHHPWLSSMGLTFPLFLILNGLFLIFWLIVQQYKLSLLPLLATTTSTPSSPLTCGGQSLRRNISRCSHTTSWPFTAARKARRAIRY